MITTWITNVQALWFYLLPFIQLFADVTPLIEVGEAFRNGQEPKKQKQDCMKECI